MSMEVSICDLRLGAIFSLGLSTHVSLPVSHVTSFTGQNELWENFDSGVNGNRVLRPFLLPHLAIRTPRSHDFYLCQ